MSTICFYAQFTASKVGVNGLTVTWDVERITRSDGTRSALVTGGSNSVTVGRRGLYGYVLSSADLLLYDYIATAITATTTVDSQEVPAIWTLWSLSWHDVATSALSVVGSIGKLFVDYLDAAISAVPSAVNTALTASHGSGSWLTGGSGTGSVAHTYTVTSSVSSAGVPDVSVVAYSDSGLTTAIAHGITDAFGSVVFYLDPGTYYFVSKKAGYEFSNPDQETVS